MWEDFPILVLDPYISNITPLPTCFCAGSQSIHLLIGLWPSTFVSRYQVTQVTVGLQAVRIDATVPMGCNAHEPHEFFAFN